MIWIYIYIIWYNMYHIWWYGYIYIHIYIYVCVCHVYVALWVALPSSRPLRPRTRVASCRCQNWCRDLRMSHSSLIHRWSMGTHNSNGFCSECKLPCWDIVRKSPAFAAQLPLTVPCRVSRSGLMRLRGDLNKVDIVITQMTLENLQKRQVHLSQLRSNLGSSPRARDWYDGTFGCGCRILFSCHIPLKWNQMDIFCYVKWPAYCYHI